MSVYHTSTITLAKCGHTIKLRNEVDGSERFIAERKLLVDYPDNDDVAELDANEYLTWVNNHVFVVCPICGEQTKLL